MWATPNGCRWSGAVLPTGRRREDELFFWQDSTLMVATVRTASRFGVEGIQPLFAVSVESGDRGNYAVAPDGERFLIRVRNPAALATEIQVVVNWFEELKGRVRN